MYKQEWCVDKHKCPAEFNLIHKLFLGQQFFCFSHNDLQYLTEEVQNNRILGDPWTNPQTKFGFYVQSPFQILAWTTFLLFKP